jgi:hypothetical protein
MCGVIPADAGKMTGVNSLRTLRVFAGVEPAAGAHHFVPVGAIGFCIGQAQ